MDGTPIWAFIRQRKSQGTLVVVGIIIFIVGWQTGRTMSPYYAAHPIVFEDKACMRAGGSPEELTKLREEGTKSVLPSPQVVAAVAAASSTVPTVAVAPTEAAQLYVGSINSNLYHHKDCPSANQIKEENKVWFATPEEAEKAGYTASKCTQEKLGRTL